jgi:hypothetical protein
VPTLLQFSAAPHPVLIGFSGAYPQISCAPNRRSNPIAHRVRRKHQRLPPSLLIENASDRVLLRRESSSFEAFPIKPSGESELDLRQVCEGGVDLAPYRSDLVDAVWFRVPGRLTANQ